jgi:hypothetical protein
VEWNDLAEVDRIPQAPVVDRPHFPYRGDRYPGEKSAIAIEDGFDRSNPWYNCPSHNSQSDRLYPREKCDRIPQVAP